jgi:MFS transporter, ACS family, hexuronate transporter
MSVALTIPDPATRQAQRPGGAWRWWIAIVLFLATVLTYLDRQTLSVCGPMICEEFSLSNEQYGNLVAAFRWTYAIVHVPAGFIVDRFSLRMTYAVAVAVWSAAGAAAAMVLGGRQLLLTRAVLGVGEAFNWPCATRIIANVLPSEDRGLGSGIFNSGAAVGSLIAPLIITPIAVCYGWRMAFVAIGAMGFVWIPLWMWTTRRANVGHLPAEDKTSTGREPASLRRTIASLRAWSHEVLLHPAFWMLLVIGVSVNPCWYFLNEWIPKYMHDQHGMGYLSAGLVTIPIFLGADLGNLLSGALVKYLTTRGWTLRKARGTTLSLAALLIMPTALLAQASSPWIVVGVLTLSAMGITSFVANYTACMQDFSFANVGIVTGILGMACNVFSASANPWIGRYVDATGNYTLIFVLMGALPVVSIGAVLAFDAIIDRGEKS